MSAPDRNPMMDDAGTHTLTPKLRFISGRLSQLWLPCDWTVNGPEWREVPDETPPVVVTDNSDGSEQT